MDDGFKMNWIRSAGSTIFQEKSFPLISQKMNPVKNGRTEIYYHVPQGIKSYKHKERIGRKSDNPRPSFLKFRVIRAQKYDRVTLR